MLSLIRGDPEIKNSTITFRIELTPRAIWRGPVKMPAAKNFPDDNLMRITGCTGATYPHCAGKQLYCGGVITQEEDD